MSDSLKHLLCFCLRIQSVLIKDETKNSLKEKVCVCVCERDW